MNLEAFWRAVHAHADEWVLVLLCTLPLATLHWLALRYSEG